MAKKVIAAVLMLLVLFGCYLGPDVSTGTNYREKGEPATTEDIVGVWDSSWETNDGQVDVRYTIIRSDGTYIDIDYADSEYAALDNNGIKYIGCYTSEETSFTYVENGRYIQGGNNVEIYLYENRLGLYNHYSQDFDLNDNEFFTQPSSILEPTTLTDGEAIFLPVCE